VCVARDVDAIWEHRMALLKVIGISNIIRHGKEDLTGRPVGAGTRWRTSGAVLRLPTRHVSSSNHAWGWVVHMAQTVVCNLGWVVA
jgi:hypothetical protein